MAQSQTIDIAALRPSKNTVLLALPRGRFAAWNKYSPRITVLDSRAYDVWQALLHPSAAPIPTPTKAARDILKQFWLSHLAIVERQDPYRESFFNDLESLRSSCIASHQELVSKRLGYATLIISNSRCNLRCPYCIQAKSRPPKVMNSSSVQDLSRSTDLLSIVDRFIISARTAHSTPNISFNGGEPLLEWPIITQVVNHISRTYPQLTPHYSINTNMTLLTPDMAQFLIDFNFQVSPSIDGYEEHHDVTRRYADGSGSFSSVARSIEIYNRLSQRGPLRGFQGTINDSSFDILKVFDLATLGFTEGRMTPNLLGISVSDAENRARVLINLLHESRIRAVAISDASVSRLSKILSGDAYHFSPYCSGILGYPNKAITVDISRWTASLICGFAPRAAVSLRSIGCDIFHPKLIDAASYFATQRIAAVTRYCSSCEVIAVCRGGCVMNGLDFNNQPNPAACAFQIELWRGLIKLMCN